MEEYKVERTEEEWEEIKKLPKSKILDLLFSSRQGYRDLYDRYVALAQAVEERIGTRLNYINPKLPLYGRKVMNVKAAQKGLDDGRKEGLIKRTAKAAANLEIITKAIDELYKNGEGWRKTYPEIANFLIERKISSNKYSTTLKKVKTVAPAIKQKHKSGQ